MIMEINKENQQNPKNLSQLERDHNTCYQRRYIKLFSHKLRLNKLLSRCKNNFAL